MDVGGVGAGFGVCVRSGAVEEADGAAGSLEQLDRPTAAIMIATIVIRVV